MTFGARLAISIALIVVGIAALVVILTLQLDNDAPSWLHWFTWLGGGLFAAGVGTLSNAIRTRKSPPLS